MGEITDLKINLARISKKLAEKLLKDKDKYLDNVRKALGIE